MSRFEMDVLLGAMTRRMGVDQKVRELIRTAVALGLIVAGGVALSCSSKDPLLQSRDAGSDTPSSGTGGSGPATGGAGASASGGIGGRLATGGEAGGMPPSASGGAAAGGHGGMAGSNQQVSGTGGHDIAPVMC